MPRDPPPLACSPLPTSHCHQNHHRNCHCVVVVVVGGGGGGGGGGGLGRLRVAASDGAVSRRPRKFAPSALNFLRIEARHIYIFVFAAADCLLVVGVIVVAGFTTTLSSSSSSLTVGYISSRARKSSAFSAPPALSPSSPPSEEEEEDDEDDDDFCGAASRAEMKSWTLRPRESFRETLAPPEESTVAKACRVPFAAVSINGVCPRPSRAFGEHFLDAVPIIFVVFADVLDVFVLPPLLSLLLLMLLPVVLVLMSGLLPGLGGKGTPKSTATHSDALPQPAARLMAASPLSLAIAASAPAPRSRLSTFGNCGSRKHRRPC